MKLLERVREHLQRRAVLAVDKDGAKADVEMQAATAILLLEAAYGDEEYAWSEHRTIVRGLERDFGIGRKETLELLGRAEAIRPPVVALADVTDVICDRYDPDQREEVASLVWRVIEADHVVEGWEEAFGKHVARALNLSVRRAEEARHRVMRM